MTQDASTKHFKLLDSGARAVIVEVENAFEAWKSDDIDEMKERARTLESDAETLLRQAREFRTSCELLHADRMSAESS